jgi:copper chaperone CopZ
VVVTLTRVRQLPGIKEVTGDLATNTLVVTFDQEQVTPEQIIEAVNEVGYQVEETFTP